MQGETKSKPYIKMMYMKLSDLALDENNSSTNARANIADLDANANLVVKLSVNSPVYVIDALPATLPNIRKLSAAKQE
jgi:hypothetical protein